MPGLVDDEDRSAGKAIALVDVDDEAGDRGAVDPGERLHLDRRACG